MKKGFKVKFIGTLTREREFFIYAKDEKEAEQKCFEMKNNREIEFDTDLSDFDFDSIDYSIKEIINN